MKIVINNEAEAKDFLAEIQGYLIAELMCSKLIKQPEPLRLLIYNMLLENHSPD